MYTHTYIRTQYYMCAWIIQYTVIITYVTDYHKISPDFFVFFVCLDIKTLTQFLNIFIFILVLLLLLLQFYLLFLLLLYF